ncbi:MAG: 6-aminohexanoate hydrolase, partial [Nitratireductor sp.]
QLVLDGGVAKGRQVVPADWISDLRTSGSRSAWADGDFVDLFAQGRYRACGYSVGDDHGSLAAIGIHEQWLWIDPQRRVVLAKLSSRPEPSHDPATRREAAMLARIARAL